MLSFSRLLKSGSVAPPVFPANRRYERFDQDRCVGFIGGRTYPVENWSLGGVMVMADDRAFGVGQAIDITLRFKLGKQIIDVKQKANVLRKGSNRVACMFDPLNSTTRKGFQHVIDDRTARAFADSQIH